MPTERGEREVRRLLGEAEAARNAGDRGRTRELGEAALFIDPGNLRARAFVARATVRRRPRNFFGWPTWVWAALGSVAFVVVGVGGVITAVVVVNAKWDGPGDRCESASSEFVRRLESGLEPGLSLSHVQAVRSEHILRWYVAADIDGPGLEGDDELGTWVASGGFGGPVGLEIYALDSRAVEFSDWDDAGDLRVARFDADDARAERARSCVLETGR